MSEVRSFIPCPEPGVYREVPEGEYRRWDAANQSFLCDMLDTCPETAMYRQLRPDEPTPAMAAGTAYHCLVLEPDKFDKRYEVFEDGFSLRSKANKLSWQIAIDFGKIPLKTDANLEAIYAMADRLRQHKYYPLLESAESEVCIVWDDEPTGVRCKARLDGWFDGTIIDLKTTASKGMGDALDDRVLANTVVKFGYDLQAAFYMDGARQAFGMSEDEMEFALFIQDKSPTYQIALRFLDNCIPRGRRRYQEALMLYAQCKSDGVWPGLSEEPKMIELPKWALDE